MQIGMKGSWDFISTQGEGLCLWDLGLQDEQLERAGMWLVLGEKDDRTETTGTRGVLGILKVRTSWNFTQKKLRVGFFFDVEPAPEPWQGFPQPAGSARFGEGGGFCRLSHLCSLHLCSSPSGC